MIDEPTIRERRNRRQREWRARVKTGALRVGVDIYDKDVAAMERLGFYDNGEDHGAAIRHLLDAARVIHEWERAIDRSKAPVVPLSNLHRRETA